MPDYSKGKIYIIKSPHTEQVYIGSTTQTLSKRIGQHREKYIKYKNGEWHYTSVYDILDKGNASINLLYEFPCENKFELEREELKAIKENLNCVNIRTPSQTRNERYKLNPVPFRENYKKWYKNNNYDYICDCGKKIKFHSLKVHLKSQNHTNYLIKNSL